MQAVDPKLKALVKTLDSNAFVVIAELFTLKSNLDYQ